MGMLALVLALSVAQTPSRIKRDEVVTFFPTFGHPDRDGDAWVLRLHGWIHEPEKSSRTRQEALELFARSLGLREQDARAARFRERAWPFLADNERGKRIAVRLGEKTYTLGESDAGGHFRGTVRLPGREVRRLLGGRGPGGWLTFRAVMRRGDRREFEGRIQVLGAKGVSVISDIDDTVKVTEVRDPAALLANTFLRAYQPVPGMSGLYRAWARRGAAFHYVSASPWQLYGPLAEFFRQHSFPAGTFHLLDFRWKDERLLNLFASSYEKKRRALVTILEAFPGRRFVLVGDSGEKDPELYGALAREYRKQVARVLIRDVTGEGAGADRYRKAFEGLPEGLWVVFRSPENLGRLKEKPWD